MRRSSLLEIALAQRFALKSNGNRIFERRVAQLKRECGYIKPAVPRLTAFQVRAMGSILMGPAISVGRQTIAKLNDLGIIRHIQGIGALTAVSSDMLSLTNYGIRTWIEVSGGYKDSGAELRDHRLPRR